MPPDPIPRDPVYMTYLFTGRVPQASPERTSSAYRPATGLTHTELQLESRRGIYQHFHRWGHRYDGPRLRLYADGEGGKPKVIPGGVSRSWL